MRAMDGLNSDGSAPAGRADGDQTVYLRNMALLWRFDPQLARCVDSVTDAARCPVEPTRGGDWTVQVTPADGSPLYLHSRYDPVAEATRFAEGVNVDEQYCFVVGGFGLGYHLRAIHERLTAECILIVTEPSLPLLAAALAAVDLSDLLGDGRLIILTDGDKARLHDRLKPHTALMMLGTQFVSHPASHRAAGSFHGSMRRLITDYAAYSRTTIMTLLSNAEITCRNVAHNLARYVSTPPIDVLRDRFKGMPAIVVSAGPSLRRNVDLLAEAKGRAVICAVQTTLKPLLARGITPDFVTSLDFHEISGHYFEGAEGLEDVHLVAEPKATWHVIDGYPGPVSLLYNDFARLLIGDELAHRDGLPAGATVAHLAFYLARYMGCDPIILIGQDLAYTGHVFYVPGVEIHRTWQSELNRFNTLETREWERIVRNRKILRTVPDNNGRPVYTDDLLFTYLEQFEKDIASTSARVINATEGGARMAGTEVATLADVLARYCSSPIPPGRFAYRDQAQCDAALRLEQLREQVANRLSEIAEMEDVCGQMTGLLEELSGLTHDAHAFNRRLVRVDELRARVNAAERAYRIIHSATQVAELRRFSADRRLAAGTADGVERAVGQLKRDRQYVADIRDGAKRMRELLSASLDRIESAMARAANSASERLDR